MNGKVNLTRRILSAIVLLAIASQACTLSLFSPPTLVPNTPSANQNIPTSTPYPATQTNFVVTLPEPLQAGETLLLVVLDEVTGLSLNPQQYPMTARDTLTYTATIPTFL
ncbi:MAG: hypothetical protein UZ14_CFX002002624 [Chloroflexi bacterium OLB14]|nr:MAG: hypothetical protein UZ14_CFX002002624 [Chloroflexi bacterium OLB14]